MALAGVALTPPGRAAAEALGELVGIGDEPTIDHQGSIAEGGPGVPAAPGSEALVGAPEGPEVVIGTGTAPGGARFEVTAYRTNAPDPGAADPNADGAIPTAPGLALAVDFPGVDGRPLNPGSLMMGPLDQWGSPTDSSYGPGGMSELTSSAVGADALVVGDAPAQAASIEVTYTDPASGRAEPLPSELFTVGSGLLDQLGVETGPFSYYVAFVPQVPGGDAGFGELSVETKVYDAQGAEIPAAR